MRFELVAVLLLFGHGGCSGGGKAPDTGVVDTGPGGSPFGLDSRPSNGDCRAPDRPSSDADVSWARVFPSLTFDSPVQMLQLDGDDSRWWVVEQNGLIRTFENDASASTPTTVLDLRGVITTGYELGVLGMDFHPAFADNGYVFVHYNTYGGGYNSVISRFTSTDGGLTIARSSEVVILEVDQPASNHNGGQVSFGPDGYLYVSLGDGGGSGDTYGNGQDPTTVLGTILRLDVDGGSPYAIPSDNPFADGGGAPEIFAWGLRNAWRFSFDAATGDLWAGDVGQYDFEEVDLVELGGNYGWPIYEGMSCYSPPCDPAGLVAPVTEYPQSSVGASVVMGPVYRGIDIPALTGTPLYTDFFDGILRGVGYDAISGEAEEVVLFGATGRYVSSFGTDAQGEVYVTDYYSGGIWKLVPASKAVKSSFPQWISETGCVDDVDATLPASGLISYTVNVDFWSDGAEKERWMALPDGETITIDAEGDWDFPVGSVLVKHFELGGERFETRLFVRHADGEWGGYTYRWNEDGTDAEVQVGGATDQVDGQTWSWPSSSECLACHTDIAGRSLGLTTAQLNTSHTYLETGRTADQLETLAEIGLFSAALDGVSKTLAIQPDPFGAEDIETRAKSYLDVNCAFCHQPGGAGGGSMDLRLATAMEDMAVCDVVPERGRLDIEHARLISPGSPDRSVLSVRMKSEDVNRMPGVGSLEVDDEGVAVVDAWIESIKACP